MAQPPTSPPSSDIEGINRDEAKTVARGKPPAPDQQEQLGARTKENAARPPYDPEITPQPNSR
jgi:hypothetical protein